MNGKKRIALLVTIVGLMTAAGFVSIFRSGDVSALVILTINPWGVAIGNLDAYEPVIDRRGLNDLAYSARWSGGADGRVTVEWGNGQGEDWFFNEPRGVAIGDLDNNGVNELAIAEFGESRVVFMFSDAVGGIVGLNGPTGVAIGDYDNDGFNEVAYSEFGSGTVRFARIPLGEPILPLTDLNGPEGVSIGDFNNDGFNDFAVAESAAGRVTVYSSNHAVVKQWTGLVNPVGVAIGDYDNDGLNEIAFSEKDESTHWVTVFKSDGKTVVKKIDGGGAGVAIGDYNSDGLNDIAFADGVSLITVYMQTVPGTVARVIGTEPKTQLTGLEGPFSVAIGDFDNDGFNDIAFTEPFSSIGVTVQKTDGTIIKQWTTGLNRPYGVAIGDYDNDGSNDIAFTQFEGNVSATVFKSDGTTIIRQWKGLNDPYGVAIGDYDNDGLNDIAFTETGTGIVTVYESDGSTLQWTGLDYPVGVAIGDYDNDGLNDLAFTEGHSGHVSVYRNDGTRIGYWGYFGHELQNPSGVTIGDYDNDGFNDIAFSESGAGRVNVYQSDGRTLIRQLTGLVTPTGVAIGDFNNDGLNDLACAEYDGYRIVVHSQTRPGTVARVAQPTIVTLRGTLINTSGYPILSGSMRVTIKDPLGAEVWQDTFDNVVDNGTYNLPLGTKTKLMLVKGQIYSAILEVDAYAPTFVSADVTFGDNNPPGDLIKFVAS